MGYGAQGELGNSRSGLCLVPLIRVGWWDDGVGLVGGRSHERVGVNLVTSALPYCNQSSTLPSSACFVERGAHHTADVGVELLPVSV